MCPWAFCDFTLRSELDAFYLLFMHGAFLPDLGLSELLKFVIVMIHMPLSRCRASGLYISISGVGNVAPRLHDWGMNSLAKGGDIFRIPGFFSALLRFCKNSSFQNNK